MYTLIFFHLLWTPPVLNLQWTRRAIHKYLPPTSDHHMIFFLFLCYLTVCFFSSNDAIQFYQLAFDGAQRFFLQSGLCWLACLFKPLQTRIFNLRAKKSQPYFAFSPHPPKKSKNKKQNKSKPTCVFIKSFVGECRIFSLFQFKHFPFSRLFP